ncbi:MAG: hypothetical protein PHC78_11430, partial [Verrucomicrobiota bacterium]|nr:hypothetical protein [Verrucomicrobiota bacterium]
MKRGLRMLMPGTIILAGILTVLLLAKVLPARQETLPPSDPPPVNVEVLTVEPLPALPDRLRLHAV